METKDRIIVPLDVPDVKMAAELVNLLSSHVGSFKIGLEFIWSSMAELILLPSDEAICRLGDIRNLAEAIGGKRCFMDAKLADIPNTVKGASVAISRMGVKMFNVHASAGIEAMMAVVANKGQSLVLAVTVLTSLEENNAHLIFGGPSKARVLQLARDAKIAGCDGIICSPQELEFLGKQKELNGLLKVTPGVRPEWAVAGDQKRIMTPAEAIKAGADYLVIGRPITQPPPEIGDPVEAAKKITEEIDQALKEKGVK